LSHLTNSLRLRGLLLNAALLLALASGPGLVGQAVAQGGQGMANMPGMTGSKPAQAMTAASVGTVESVDVQQRKIKLNHEPIPAFGWPAMSMEMAAAPSVDVARVKPGSKVRFTVSKAADGSYTVDSLSAE